MKDNITNFPNPSPPYDLLHPQPFHDAVFFQIAEAQVRDQIAKINRTGVQITSGSSVKWKVVNPPSTIARTTTPTAKLLMRYDAPKVKIA